MRGPGVALGAPVEERGRERVDPFAEHGEDGGEDDERDRGGDQRHQRSADAHRVEEALREDDQRRDRAGDGQGAEEDGASGGRHRALHRLHAGPTGRDLLAVARDDEQAVVDRQPEAEAGDQVEGEDRDVGELARDAQGDHRRDDREPADEQRQQRGDQAAEEEEGEEEEQREGVELGRAQVGLDLLVGLRLGQRRAAHGDPGLALERLGDPLRGVLGPLVVGRREGGRDVGGIAVVRDEVLRAVVQIARHARDVRLVAELAGDALDPLPAGRGGHVDAVDQHDHARVPVARALQQPIGADALGRRVVGAVGGEAVGDAGPEGGGGHEQDRGQHEDPLTAALGELGEALEHHGVPPAASAAARSSSARARAHQSIIHSLASTP